MICEDCIPDCYGYFNQDSNRCQDCQFVEDCIDRMKCPDCNGKMAQDGCNALICTECGEPVTDLRYIEKGGLR